MIANKTSAERVAFKKKVLEAGILKHQMVIDDFKQSITEMTSSEGAEDEKEFASSQQSFNKETIDHANQLAGQLQFATHEMSLLQNMLSSIQTLHPAVKLGSIVETDLEMFFVSASIERFEADGQKVFGLSTKSPLYKAMEGKKTGDTFTFNKRTYYIKEVY
jgi:hypothetical protein